MASVGDPDAITVIYQPSAGDARSVAITVEKGILNGAGGFESVVSIQGIIIEAALDDLGKEPDRDETFTAPDLTVYKVLSIQENDGHTVKIQVTL